MKRNFSSCACHLGPKLPVLFVWSNRVLNQEADTQPVVSWFWAAYRSSDPWFFLCPSLLSTPLCLFLCLFPRQLSLRLLLLCYQPISGVCAHRKVFMLGHWNTSFLSPTEKTGEGFFKVWIWLSLKTRKNQANDSICLINFSHLLCTEQVFYKLAV